MASRSSGQPARLKVGAPAATPDQSPHRSAFTQSFDSHYVRGGPEGRVRTGGALAIPVGQTATPHPATPSTSVLDRLLNLGREHPDPVVEWAGRRVDFRLTEKRHGVEV